MTRAGSLSSYVEVRVQRIEDLTTIGEVRLEREKQQGLGSGQILGNTSLRTYSASLLSSTPVEQLLPAAGEECVSHAYFG